MAQDKTYTKQTKESCAHHSILLAELNPKYCIAWHKVYVKINFCQTPRIGT